MDQETFDAFVQKLSRLKSRRSAVAALLGGTLLLHNPAQSEATDKAKRRKRRARKRENRSASHRGVLFSVHNAAGTKPVVVGPGGVCEGLCCVGKVPVTLAAGANQNFETRCATGWLFIKGTYWFQVTNPLIGKPYLSIAEGGRFNGHNVSCCQTHLTGSTIEYLLPMSEGQSRTYTIKGANFTVTRNRDSKRFKIFTITLPATL